MIITTETILRLSEEESAALKLLLGNLSQSQKSGLGLTQEQNEITFQIWEMLPESDHDNQP